MATKKATKPKAPKKVPAKASRARKGSKAQAPKAPKTAPTFMQRARKRISSGASKAASKVKSGASTAKTKAGGYYGQGKKYGAGKVAGAKKHIAGASTKRKIGYGATAGVVAGAGAVMAYKKIKNRRNAKTGVRTSYPTETRSMGRSEPRGYGYY